MKRTILFLSTAVLALATGASLLGLWLTLATPSATADEDAATASVVRRFYAAINGAIATGESAALDAIVGDDFVARGADASGDEANLDSLRDRLTGLRAAQPGLRLPVQNVVASREQAVVHVALDGLAPGEPLVVPATGPFLWASPTAFGSQTAGSSSTPGWRPVSAPPRPWRRPSSSSGPRRPPGSAWRV